MKKPAHAPGFLELVETARRKVEEVSVEETLARLEAGSIRLIDVREESEFADGHAAGAQHISKGVIERDIESQVPDKRAAVVLYCGGGFRSVLAAESLARMGYKAVASMKGGWRAWVAAGAPILKPSRKS